RPTEVSTPGGVRGAVGRLKSRCDRLKSRLLEAPRGVETLVGRVLVNRYVGTFVGRVLVNPYENRARLSVGKPHM
ncbi:MAG: hypothetical protein ACUVX1_04995, partial [Chloroflexota bacterium]